MTGAQERALEALYIAAGKKAGVVVDIRKAGLGSNLRGLNELLKRGYITKSTATSFSVTRAGAAKLAESNPKFRVDKRNIGGSMRDL